MDTKKLLLTAAVTGLCLGASSCSTTSHNHVESGKCYGINSCKGHGDCGGKSNVCAGLNNCKGKGWKKMKRDECVKEGGTFGENAG